MSNPKNTAPAQRGGGMVPAFGPTETFPCDESTEPMAVIHLAMEVSRDELRAALAIGHAELSGTPPLADMDVLDIRREVEGHLAAGTTYQLQRETAEVVRRVNDAGILADLDAAIDRAYTLPAGPPRLQPQPRSGGRTVALQTIDHGEVAFTEPTWCVGHGWQAGAGIGRNDITHNSVRVKAGAATEAHGWVPMMSAQISWAPFVELVPRVVVELDLVGEFEAEEVTHVAGALRTAASRIERVAAEAIRLRGEVL
ncbi:DUF6907 domain-containing protein [Streptomyces phaeoluteigriseus]|uniref:DUF6907 domain-containing protein n=1 Tax=Streptomyces phaeoluteigriseus TaxID=114686 RepID=UPI0036752E8D